MSIIKCRECAREISTEAKQCPGCRAVIRTAKGRGAVTIAVVGLLIVGTCAAVIAGQSSTSDGRSGVGDAYVARARCEKAELPRLESPGSAQLSGDLDTEVRANDDSTKLSAPGHVDSQNRLEAMLRGGYVCFLGGLPGAGVVSEVVVE